MQLVHGRHTWGEGCRDLHVHLPAVGVQIFRAPIIIGPAATCGVLRPRVLKYLEETRRSISCSSIGNLAKIYLANVSESVCLLADLYHDHDHVC